MFACTESNESYKFALNSITSIEPALQKLTRVVFSDRLASESVFFDCLESLQISCLCNWHLRVQNLGEKVNFHPNKVEILDDFQSKIQNALVSPDQLDMNWQGFIDKWPGAAADFLRGLENHKRRFCAAYTHQHMVLMQTGNSVAESGNFGHIVKPHREHKYEQVLSIDTSLVSTIEECDFSIDPFDVSWDFVLLEALYKDDRGQKYVKIEALTCKLELFQLKQLYTFSALKQWLDIKPKRKELLLKSGVSWNSIGVERFVRPRVLLRFSAAVLAQV